MFGSLFKSKPKTLDDFFTSVDKKIAEGSFLRYIRLRQRSEKGDPTGEKGMNGEVIMYEAIFSNAVLNRFYEEVPKTVKDKLEYFRNQEEKAKSRGYDVTHAGMIAYSN